MAAVMLIAVAVILYLFGGHLPLPTWLVAGLAAAAGGTGIGVVVGLAADAGWEACAILVLVASVVASAIALGWWAIVLVVFLVGGCICTCCACEEEA